MREIKYTPEQAKGKKPQFEGHVLLKRPDAAERMEFIEECQFKLDDKGEMLPTKNQAGAIARGIRALKPYIKAVKLRYLEDKTDFKSYEDMSYDPICDQILGELVGIIVHGFRPSKN